MRPRPTLAATVPLGTLNWGPEPAGVGCGLDEQGSHCAGFEKPRLQKTSCSPFGMCLQAEELREELKQMARSGGEELLLRAGTHTCTRVCLRTRACAHAHTAKMLAPRLWHQPVCLGLTPHTHLYLTIQITSGQRLTLLYASVSSSVNRGDNKSDCLLVLL